MTKYNFSYCQKIAVLSQDRTKVLFCKRKGETDYNRTFSFIGGKMENTENSFIESMRREKNEEVGDNFKIKILLTYSINELFKLKDGTPMILPHYLAIHVSGEIKLNEEEYSEYQWVDISKLETFEPKISNIIQIVQELIRLEAIAHENEFTLI